VGYCEEPAKTDQALVTLGSPGIRYYRSGDFVARDGAGQLVFVGRRDDAVKIAGNLVHTSEVEAAALAVDWVGDCCAVVTEHRVAGRAITLFVLGDAEGGSGDQLRDELARVLPAYMVPATIAMIGEGDVGLTPTGKLDRGRLRELVGGHD